MLHVLDQLMHCLWVIDKKTELYEKKSKYSMRVKLLRNLNELEKKKRKKARSNNIQRAISFIHMKNSIM